MLSDIYTSDLRLKTLKKFLSQTPENFNMFSIKFNIYTKRLATTESTDIKSRDQIFQSLIGPLIIEY